MTFDVTPPMSKITPARGEAAHPPWTREATGCRTFDKVPIAPDGRMAGTRGAPAQPASARISAMLQ